MSTPINKLPPLSSWLAEGLRVTAFPTPENPVIEQSWWLDIAGEVPEKKTTQPRTRVEIEEGPYQNGKLVLSLHPTRIDWQYSADQPQGPEVYANVGELSAALHVFTSSMKKWLSFENVPPLNRLAFGAVLLQPVEGIEEGYKLLSRYLRLDIDTQASNFLYQINRKRDARTDGMPGLRINRLTKWSVGSFHYYVQIVPGPISPSPIQYACRLELDINTEAEYEKELAHDRLGSLLEEFVQLGKEIVEQGDIR